MTNKTEVSNSELKVLEILYDKKEAVTIPQILLELKKQGFDWLNPTVANYLKRLQKKGIVDSVKKGQNRYFYAIVSKQEMQNEDAKKIIDTRFKGSFINFLCAFSKETKLSKEEIKQIKEWAEHLDDE